MRCVYCLPEEGIRWQGLERQLSAGEIAQITSAFAQVGEPQVRLTGGESLVRTDILDILARLASIPGIQEASLTTNAMLLEKLAGLVPIKLNTVVVKGLNDDELPALARLTVENPWHVRFIELMPVGNTQDWGEGFPSLSDRYISIQEMRARLSAFNLEPASAPVGNGPARTYRIPGAMGTVGFVSPIGEHFYQNCNRLRLTADGFLRPCLLQDNEINVRKALRSGEPLKPLLQRAVDAKPIGHELSSQNYPESRRMAQIGG